MQEYRSPKTGALLIILLFHFIIASSQRHEDRFNAIDVLNYKFTVSLSDTTDEIEASAEILIKFKKSVSDFSLDFIKRRADDKGMTVIDATENDVPLPVLQSDTQLLFSIPLTRPEEVRNYKIKYKGTPADGLIISKNRYNDRTFFADNWPDRGKNWLPLVDHPSDKATVEWVVIAPSHYQTVANGTLKEISKVSEGYTLTRWQMKEPIPTKVMVFGTARFAHQDLEPVMGVPISTWVYPQDSVNGLP